jgi:drug/metabolite transporter (DMT)-like permease
MTGHTLRQSFLLFLTAVIWGVAFVAQSAGMEYLGPFTYNGVRSVLGGMVLLPCIALLNKIQAAKPDTAEGSSVEGRNIKKSGKELAAGGLCCGFILFAASNFQQFGIQYTTVGKAGFITAMYILIVPILGLLVHKKAGLQVWIGVVFGIAGLYLLCMTDSFSLEKGDALVLICAFIFSLHILVIDHFSQRVDGIKMSCIQFWVCGILSLFCSFLFERPDLQSICDAWLPVCYGGIMSCGVAYTLQIVGQKDMNPTVASLILSLESVVAAAAGFLLLGQAMSLRELVGCLMMVMAITSAQLPERKKTDDRIGRIL